MLLIHMHGIDTNPLMLPKITQKDLRKRTHKNTTIKVPTKRPPGKLHVGARTVLEDEKLNAAINALCPVFLSDLHFCPKFISKKERIQLF